VEDTGRGIPEAHLSKIFDRFHQVESNDNGNDASMGIGLSLTKELVTLLKGSIEVESEVDKGSVFTVVLPVSRDSFINCEWVVPEKTDEDLIQGERLPVQLESITEYDQTLYAEKSHGNPEILIVEDNADLRNYISQMLNSQYFITEAVNGKEGLQMALERIPDLIISDIMMPVMGGGRMCKLLKEDPKTDHIPIIMLTARADKRSKLAGLETGADDYIIKPFETEELQVRVRNLIAQREKLREKFRKEFVMKSHESAPASPQDHLLQKILEILEQHISDSEFHIDQLSRALNMSRAQLFRKVQALTGFSPKDLLRKIRLKKAAEMFDHGHNNISQVMYEVGFNNPSYFAICFKKLYHLNPSEYIKARTSKEFST
jgi:DNA-binding response OmpR family regulator